MWCRYIDNVTQLNLENQNSLDLFQIQTTFAYLNEAKGMLFDKKDQIKQFLNKITSIIDKRDVSHIRIRRNVSDVEVKVKQILEQKMRVKNLQSQFKPLKDRPFTCDLYLPETNTIIEMEGPHHHILRLEDGQLVLT